MKGGRRLWAHEELLCRVRKGDGNVDENGNEGQGFTPV